MRSGHSNGCYLKTEPKVLLVTCLSNYDCYREIYGPAYLYSKLCPVVIVPVHFLDTAESHPGDGFQPPLALDTA
jgi:hypothetical protein